MKKALIDLGLDGRNTMIHEIFWRLDNNNSASLDFEEFLEMMTATMILGSDMTKFRNYFRVKMVSRQYHQINGSLNY